MCVTASALIVTSASKRSLYVTSGVLIVTSNKVTIIACSALCAQKLRAIRIVVCFARSFSEHKAEQAILGTLASHSSLYVHSCVFICTYDH